MKVYSPYFSLFERNLKLPIDIILSEHQEPTNEQPDHNNFIQIWEAQIKEAFKIAEKNTKKRKSANKKQRDLKATLKFRNCKQGVLVRIVTERDDLVKFGGRLNGELGGVESYGLRRHIWRVKVS